MKPLFAALAFAAVLGAALPARAEPSPDDDLRLLGQTDEFAYFFSESSRTSAGQDIDVWVLAALQRTTHTAGARPRRPAARRAVAPAPTSPALGGGGTPHHQLALCQPNQGHSP